MQNFCLVVAIAFKSAKLITKEKLNIKRVTITSRVSEILNGNDLWSLYNNRAQEMTI